MPHKLFVNIAVENLDRSVEFFTKLGFAFDERFTDETATCMLVGEDAYFMVITRERFGDFTKKPLSDAAASTEAIYAISCDSREDVDRIADTAAAGGGSALDEPQDQGWMYSRAFSDPDGHHFDVFWMDPKALEQAPEEAATAA
jgi:predicted lactoylglutathione lyase